MTNKQEAAERMADAFGEVADLIGQPRTRRQKIADRLAAAVLVSMWIAIAYLWLAG